MRTKLFHISTALLLSTTQMQAQWHLAQPSPDRPVDDLQVLGSDTLYASSWLDHAILLRSTNAAASLDTIDFPEFNRIKPHFVSAQTGFVLGLNPAAFTDKLKVLKTNDGGATWQPTSFSWNDLPYHFHIHFIDGERGFVSTGDTLHRTTDGGSTFSTQRLMPGPHYISDIHFLNAQTGFVALVATQIGDGGYRDIIFKTTNGGDTWTQVYSELPKPQLLFVYPGISQMQFVNDQLGYALSSGLPGALFKTTNGGDSWDTLSVDFVSDHYELRGVHFLSEQVGYVGADVVYKTIDGGQNWVAQQFHPQGDHYVTALQMVNEGLGYVTGNGIFKTTNGGGSLDLKSARKSDLGIKLYPNPSSGAVFMDKPAELQVEGMQVIDASGRTLETIAGAATKIETAAYAKGSYWLIVATNKGITSIPFVRH